MIQLLVALFMLGVGVISPAQSPTNECLLQPVTQAEIDGWLPELTASLEKSTGRSFAAPPRVKVVAIEGLADALQPAILARRRQTLRNVDDIENVRESIRLAKSRASKRFSHYVRQDRTIYIVADGAARVPGLASLKAEERTPVFKLCVVYEMAAALLHQEKVESEEDIKPEDFERAVAVSAVSTGAMLFMTRRASADLGIAAAMEQFDRYRKFELPQESEAKPLQDLFIKGEEFINHHFKAGGAEGVWAVLHHLPRTEREIRQPGWKPAGGDQKLPDFKPAADRVQALFQAPWDSFQVEVSETLIGSFLTGMEPEDSEALLKSGVGGRLVMGRLDQPRQMLACAFVHVGDRTKIKSYIDSIRTRTEAKLTRMKSLGGTCTDVTVEQLGEVVGDHCLRVRFDAALGGQKVQEETLVVARGQTIIEVNAIAPSVDRQQVLDVLRAALNEEPKAPAGDKEAKPGTP